jgi:diaminopimelate decarboxylase
MVSDPRWCPTDGVVRQLAIEFGTPIYVIDESNFRSKIRDYRASFLKFDPSGVLTFASKANSVVGVLKIAHSEGCLIDCASEGELRAALMAGVPAKDCHLHGNNKSRSELDFAIDQEIGQIVADNREELELILDAASGAEVVLRLAPGVLPITNEKISTGQSDTKFGFSIDDGDAERAVKFCIDSGLNLVGFHCHVGSQLLDPEAQIAAGQILAEFARSMHDRYGFDVKILNVGGGRAVSYTDEQPVPLDEYNDRLVGGVRVALEGSGLRPVLVQEPGRSLIAEAGVTIYQVGVVKDVARSGGGRRRFVVVDGGLADNPRPALYGARYGIIGVSGDGRELGELSPATVSGRHCEVDQLFEDVDLPNDLRAGDFVAVLTTGAYSSSMASNYNRYPRPMTVLVREDGRFSVLQRAENFEEMLSREVLPEDLK